MLGSFKGSSRICFFLGGLSLQLLGLTGAREVSASDDPYGSMGVTPEQAVRERDDEAPRMSSTELRHTFPDLTLRESPPCALISAQFGMHIPYQVLGVGAGMDLYPTRKLRIGALYSFGFSPVEASVTASHYAEASLGVALFSRTSDTALALTTRAIPYADPVTLEAFVPSYRAVFVEAGAITGFFSPARCTDHCSDEGNQKTLVADSRQFVLPFLGLRYVFYYSVSSEHAGFRKRQYLQIYAHALGKAFNSPGHPIFDYKGDSLQRGPIGGRVGFDVAPPFCIAGVVLSTGCAQGGLAIGYNPTPGFAFLEFHLSYLID